MRFDVARVIDSGRREGFKGGDAADDKVALSAYQAQRLMNLIATDIGRPITDIKPKLSLPDLGKMALEVIDTMSTSSIAIDDGEGHHYTMIACPYRTSLPHVGQPHRGRGDHLHRYHGTGIEEGSADVIHLGVGASQYPDKSLAARSGTLAAVHLGPRGVGRIAPWHSAISRRG